jgi:hypothetical protein
MFQPKKPKTDDVHEATDSVIDHAKLDNASTTSATTGQMAAVYANDHVPTTQHHSTISRWKKVSWNATKLTLDLVASGAFPPLQTVAGLVLNLINRCEVRYLALSRDRRIYSSKLTSANKDSIQSVVKRLQYLNDCIVLHGSTNDAGELKRRDHLNMSVSLMSCIVLYLPDLRSSSRLTKISDDIQVLLNHNVAERVLNSTDDEGTLSGFVENIRDAITEYQVRL